MRKMKMVTLKMNLNLTLQKHNILKLQRIHQAIQKALSIGL